MLFLLFITACFAQSTPTYRVDSEYASGTNCGVGPYVRRSYLESCTPGGRSACVQNRDSQCVSGVPVLFSGSVSLATYSTSQCNGNPDEQLGWTNNLCVQFFGTSYTVFCNGGTLYLFYFPDTNVCLGPGYYWTFSGNRCVPLGNFGTPSANYTSSYGFASCAPSVCFHESTSIEYEGTKMSLASLEAGNHKGVCTIPHKLQANGVAISTSCSQTPLRLTNDHFVYTIGGRRAAGSLKVGDVLFADMEEKKTCSVTKIVGEHNQKYFGLNCPVSDVLASGIKTSTFGVQHTIPAAYMKYATKIMSIEHASSIGESLVNILHRVGAL